MVYNTFNIIDLILHKNTHIIVLLAIFHILSNIRFKNTMMELRDSFQQQRKFQLWLCDHVGQIVPGINKHVREFFLLLHILFNEYNEQFSIKIIIHNLLLTV